MKKHVICLLVGISLLTACTNEDVSQKQSNTKENFGLLHLNMRLSPYDCGYIFEDGLAQIMEQKELGKVTGSGVALEHGMPITCDIELSIDKSKEEYFISFVRHLNNIAKGSYLEIGDKKIDVGVLEGLSLRLDGIHLEQKVYKENDVNDIIDEIGQLLGNNGLYYSNYVGSEYTYLYFYGSSYDKMKGIIENYVKDCPLCENSFVEKV